MFGSQKSAAQAYAKVSVETGVASASPHELIVMLFDGAITAIGKAHVAMASGQIENKGLLISKAIAIIDNGLYASLDPKAGGDIADNLAALYGYMSRRLLHANLRNDVAALLEVHKLLTDLREAWKAIKDAPARQGAAVPAPEPAQPKRAALFDSLAPRGAGFVTA